MTSTKVTHGHQVVGPLVLGLEGSVFPFPFSILFFFLPFGLPSPWGCSLPRMQMSVGERLSPAYKRFLVHLFVIMFGHLRKMLKQKRLSTKHAGS